MVKQQDKPVLISSHSFLNNTQALTGNQHDFNLELNRRTKPRTKLWTNYGLVSVLNPGLSAVCVM